MPGWHERAQKFVESGDLQVYGIAPEQYGQRMALFLQWQGLEFPVLMDPLNVLGVKAVPITLLVDESGMIRERNPSERELLEFLESSSLAPAKKAITPKLNEATKLAMEALASGKPAAVKAALMALEKKESASLKFQAGVLARWLHDHRQSNDSFQRAIDHWRNALALVPEQYIWRRRIQQYGPRLDKPYPFYSWITTAREDLQKRKIEPLPLAFEPTSSEMATPRHKNEQVDKAKRHPDPENKLPARSSLLSISCTTIPHTNDPDRVLLHFNLKPAQGAHWSSDAQDLALWLKSANGDWIFLSDTASALNAKSDTSDEARTLEVDFSPSEWGGGEFVFYYSICDSKDAVCRFAKTTFQKAANR